MGGGKSRCLCELALDLLLAHDGIEVVVARQSHVSIIESTKKTFVEQVLPREVIAHQKESQGEDFVRLVNGSTIHFIGLDDPGKQFSREIGFVIFDEAHQVSEQSVVLLNTRLRQRCKDCIKSHSRTCSHYPHGIAMAFNPEGPTHWLYRWFIENAVPFWLEGRDETVARPDGYTKAALYPKEAVRPIGDAEFVVARATENVYLPEHYVEENLGGMPKRLRDRYLDGLWVHVSGEGFFDDEALTDYAGRLVMPRLFCRSAGDVTGAARGDKLRFERSSEGESAPWWVWAPPVRESFDEELGKELPAHRYVVAVDVSSGTSNDYSGIQVIDVDSFEQVAEFQGKLDPDQLADEAFRAAVVYNGGLLAPEITGGWGAGVVARLEKLLHGYRGGASSKPKILLRRVEDRLSKKFTDKLGWDTTTASRAKMLTTLEEVLREREFGLKSFRCHSELVSFAWPDKKRTNPNPDGGPYMGVPSARPGANDDLVMTLAIGVQVAVSQPRQLRRVRRVRREPQFASTGW